MVAEIGTDKPTTTGVYRRELNGVFVYSKWDGRQWLQSCIDPTMANDQVQPSQFQILPWVARVAL